MGTATWFGQLQPQELLPRPLSLELVPLQNGRRKYAEYLQKAQVPLHFSDQIPSSNNSLRWVGSFGKSSRFGVANLTEAYSNVATSVLRGVALLDNCAR